MLETTLLQHTPFSCGIRILGQLDAGKSRSLSYAQNALAVIKLVKTELDVGHYGNFGTVVFSHRDKDAYTAALVAAIRKHNLGTVTIGPKTLNPNSSADIRTYIWTLRRGNLRNFKVASERSRHDQRWTTHAA